MNSGCKGIMIGEIIEHQVVISDFCILNRLRIQINGDCGHPEGNFAF